MWEGRGGEIEWNEKTVYLRLAMIWDCQRSEALKWARPLFLWHNCSYSINVETHSMNIRVFFSWQNETRTKTTPILLTLLEKWLHLALLSCAFNYSALRATLQFYRCLQCARRIIFDYKECVEFNWHSFTYERERERGKRARKHVLYSDIGY